MSADNPGPISHAFDFADEIHRSFPLLPRPIAGPLRNALIAAEPTPEQVGAFVFGFLRAAARAAPLPVP